jgi:hypothetical protein
MSAMQIPRKAKRSEVQANVTRVGYVTPCALFNAYRYEGIPLYWLGR